MPADKVAEGRFCVRNFGAKGDGFTKDTAAVQRAIDAASAAGGGRKASARAVGGAVGWNPICIIIPCHRVIGSDGWLTGYGGGLDNKVSLLAHEGIYLFSLETV